MCGIAAIFSYRPGSQPVDRGELRTIRDHMRTRGPDGAGEWFSSDGRTGLAHRRLSIIDLSERASQPMTTTDGSLTITFNGEIYNYKYLRRQLELKGNVFASDSDTEVLLYLYREKSTAMLGDLRGMFSFAIWDAIRKGLFLARDPYGIKPLYFSDDGHCIRVASQVKALLAGGHISTSTSAPGVLGFFLFGSVPEPYTIHEQIRSLPAGHSLWIDAKGVGNAKQYFSVPETLRSAASDCAVRSRDEVQDRVTAALKDSVAHHMIADVPVGVFLSAGIDSGALVGLVKDVGIDEVQTVTLAFDEFRGLHDDEAPLAAEVAAHYGTKHSMHLLGESEFRSDIDIIFHAMDQPSIDGINTYFVSKAAAEQGLKVALSGLGGDELFAGYNTFFDVPCWVGQFSRPARIPFLGEVFRWSYDSMFQHVLSRSPKVAGTFLYGGTYPGAYYLRRGLFMPWELDSFLPRDFIREGLQELNILEMIGSSMTPDPLSPYGRVSALETGLYMRNQLLRDTDWAGMAHSMELRVPFVDTFLLRELAPILVHDVLTFRKSVLAASPTFPLPVHIRERPKTGFQVPIHAWLEKTPGLDAWRKLPALRKKTTPWARRWSITIMDYFLPQLVEY